MKGRYALPDEKKNGKIRVIAFRIQDFFNKLCLWMKGGCSLSRVQRAVFFR
jgi:hypothetical protein